MRPRAGMLAFIAFSVLGATSFPTLSQPERPPASNTRLLQRCSGTPSANCLADLAWDLSREEKRGYTLGALAVTFAKLEQWDWARELLARIPDIDNSSRRSHFEHVTAEELARALARSEVGRIAQVEDQAVLHWTARRLLGYQSLAGYDRPRRIDSGFQSAHLIPAPSSVHEALLEKWETLVASGPQYHRQSLAEMWLLFGDRGRARRVLEPYSPNPSAVLRQLVELWLDLDEPDQALALIKASKPRDRGLYKVVIANWFKEKGRTKDAAALVADAAEDLLAASEFERLAGAVTLMIALNRTELAKETAGKANQLGEKPGPFRPFQVSAAGEMFGFIGDGKTCLRLQDQALGLQPRPGEVVAHGFIAGPITYGSGPFGLDKELRQTVAARRIGCGDKKALSDIDNRVLSRYYCSHYRRGFLGPADLNGRRTSADAPLWLLTHRATECHFEAGEPVAGRLLDRILLDAAASGNFEETRSAAEITCVYSTEKLCHQSLGATTKALLKAVQERKLAAQSVVDFAYVVGTWGTERLDRKPNTTTN